MPPPTPMGISIDREYEAGCAEFMRRRFQTEKRNGLTHGRTGPNTSRSNVFHQNGPIQRDSSVTYNANHAP